MTKKALIIGSGIAGIAAAIRLAVKGFEVEVFEYNSYPGGKLSQIEAEGYRFDAGPSLFTMPELVTELFDLAGKNPEDFFEYQKLEVICRYFWEDGTRLQAWADVDKFAREVEEVLGESAADVRNALSQSAFIYEHLAPLFLEKSLHRISTWTGQQAMKSYIKMGKLGIFSTMNQANERQFSHPKCDLQRL
jgi:phytoene dehydrogenase-like protein